MFGIGMTELLVILAVALIIFGPQRLPELARSLGRALGEFRRASTDLRQHLDEAAEAARLEPTPEEKASGSPPSQEVAAPASPLPVPAADEGPAPVAEPARAAESASAADEGAPERPRD